MKKLRVGAIVALALVAWLPFSTGDEATAATPEMQKLMQAFAAYGTPGEAHRGLAERAGAWHVTVRMRFAPGAPMQESHGRSEVEVIMGGRYLLERFTMETPDGPFEGLGLSGYDNLKKKFVAVWIDSMSTGVMTAEGTGDASGRHIEYQGDSPDPAAGRYKPVRTVETWVDEKTRRMQSYDTGPDGKEFLQMELIYTR